MAEEMKLENLPEKLQEKLKEALKSDHYMVTVSLMDDTKDDDLQHYWITRKYPKEEMVPSMEHLIEDMGKGRKTHKHVVTGETWPRERDL